MLLHGLIAMRADAITLTPEWGVFRVGSVANPGGTREMSAQPVAEFRKGARRTKPASQLRVGVWERNRARRARSRDVRRDPEQKSRDKQSPLWSFRDQLAQRSRQTIGSAHSCAAARGMVTMLRRADNEQAASVLIV